jgi:Ca2+/H+ antiporter
MKLDALARHARKAFQCRGRRCFGLKLQLKSPMHVIDHQHHHHHHQHHHNHHHHHHYHQHIIIIIIIIIIILIIIISIMLCPRSASVPGNK